MTVYLTYGICLPLEMKMGGFMYGESHKILCLCWFFFSNTKYTVNEFKYKY